MYKPEDILEAREKRVAFQNTLQKKYNMPLLVARANYPGINKDNNLTREIINIMEKILSDIFEIELRYKNLTYTAEGPIFIMVIDRDVNYIKRLSLDIENNHTLGRCVDIDVYDIDGRTISRSEIGYEPRKCFICDETAHACVRSKKHNEQEIIEYIKGKFTEYMENFYGDRR